MTNMRVFFILVGILLVLLAFISNMSHHGWVQCLGFGIGLIFFGGMLEDH